MIEHHFEQLLMQSANFARVDVRADRNQTESIEPSKRGAVDVYVLYLPEPRHCFGAWQVRCVVKLKQWRTGIWCNGQK